MAEPGPGPAGRRQPGVREVVAVALLAALAVLALALGTSLLPEALQRLVFRTPLLAIGLVVGTGLVLRAVLRGPRDGNAA